MTTVVSFDILENCTAECMKESVKNTWTNMAVTAALLLTLVVAMLQVDPMESVHFQLDESITVHLEQTYVSLLLAATGCNLLSVLCCIIYLSYVEPLCQTDVMKFLLTFPDSLGDPAIHFGTGCVLMWLAIALWVFGNYGIVQFLFAIATLLSFGSFVVWQIVTRSSFSPATSDFSWTQDDPATWQLGYLTKNLKQNPKAIEQVKKIGKLINDVDAKTSDSRHPVKDL